MNLRATLSRNRLLSKELHLPILPPLHISGASGATRTHNLKIRSLSLCPVELQTPMTYRQLVASQSNALRGPFGKGFTVPPRSLRDYLAFEVPVSVRTGKARFPCYFYPQDCTCGLFSRIQQHCLTGRSHYFILKASHGNTNHLSYETARYYRTSVEKHQYVGRIG